jgi:hypothetical protein
VAYFKVLSLHLPGGMEESHTLLGFVAAYRRWEITRVFRYVNNIRNIVFNHPTFTC